MSKLHTKTITTPTGKRKYIRAATKEELERKYQQAKLEIGAGVDIADSTLFGEFAQLWYNTYKRPNLRENRPLVFGATRVQHSKAFDSRKQPKLFLDFYSRKAKKKPCNH